MANILENAWNWTEENIGGAIERADKWMREHGMPDIYIGYNSNSGPNARIQTNSQQKGISKPSGYSRTSAATAKDIAQGGMTKDEVIEFNMKHPNETAKRSE